MRLAVDVIETDDAFTFATDVPGVSREDVKVRLASPRTWLLPPMRCSHEPLLSAAHQAAVRPLMHVQASWVNMSAACIVHGS